MADERLRSIETQVEQMRAEDSAEEADQAAAPAPPEPTAAAVPDMAARAPSAVSGAHDEAFQRMLDMQMPGAGGGEFAPKPSKDEEAGFFHKVWNAAVPSPLGGVAEGLGNILSIPGKIPEMIGGQKLDPAFLAAVSPGLAGLNADAEALIAIGKSDFLKPLSFVGSLTHGLGQILAPTVLGAGPAVAAVEARAALLTASKAGQWILSNGTAGLVSGVVSFDPHDERIANLVRDYSKVDNPVLNFLASDKEDSLAELYLASAIENAGLGVLAGGLFRSAKWAKQKYSGWKAVAKETGTATVPSATVTEVVGDVIEAQIGHQHSLDFVNTAKGKVAESVAQGELFAAPLAKNAAETAALTKELATTDPNGNLRALLKSGSAQHLAHEEALVRVYARYAALKNTAEWKNLPPLVQDRLERHVLEGGEIPKFVRQRLANAGGGTVADIVADERRNIDALMAQRALAAQTNERLIAVEARKAELNADTNKIIATHDIQWERDADTGFLEPKIVHNELGTPPPAEPAAAAKGAEPAAVTGTAETKAAKPASAAAATATDSFAPTAVRTFGIKDTYTAALRSPKMGQPEVEQYLDILHTQGPAAAAKEAGRLFNYSIMGDDPAGIVEHMQALGKLYEARFPAVTGGTETFAQSRGIINNLIDMGGDKIASGGRWMLSATRNAGHMMQAMEAYMGGMAEQLKILAVKIDVEEPNADDVARFVDLAKKTLGVMQLLKGTQTNIARALSMRREAMRSGYKTPSLDTVALEETIGSRGGARRLAKRIAAAPDATGVIKEASKIKIRHVAYEVFVNGILSGVKTNIVNNVSNASIALWSPIEKGLISLPLAIRSEGWAAGSALAYHQTMDRYSSYMDTIVAGGRMFGRLFGMRVDESLLASGNAGVWKDTYTALRTGQALHGGVGQDILHRSGQNAITGALVADTRFSDMAKWVDFAGTVTRMPSRLLTTADAMFYNLSYMAEMQAAARGAAREAGVPHENLRAWMDNWLQNAPPERLAALEKTAKGVGLENTFQNPLVGFGKTVQNVTYHHPMLKFALPFVRTPTNIIRWGANRSPLGLVMRDNWKAMSGALGPEKMTEVYGKMMIGTSFLAAALTAAQNGVLVGQGPSDPIKKAAWLADGKIPNSIKISLGGAPHYLIFNRADPIGLYLGIMGDISQGFGDIEDKDWEELGWTMLTGLTKTISNKTYLKGISGLTDAISDPDRNMLNFAASTANSFIPFAGLRTDMMTLTSEGETVKDWKVRDEDGHMQILASIGSYIASKTPWMEDGVNSKRNIFGDPIDPTPGISMKVINPYWAHMDAPPTPIEQEVARLELPLSMDRFRQLKGITLTPDQRSALIHLALKAGPVSGQDIKDEWNTMVTTPGWSVIPEGGREKEDWGLKRQMISDVFERRINIARSILIQTDPTLQAAITKKAQDIQMNKQLVSDDNAPADPSNPWSQFMLGVGGN